MTMNPANRLRALTQGADAMLWGHRASVWLSNMAWGSTLGGALETLQGANVLLRTRDQFFAALALIDLDGIAARIVVAPPDLPPKHLATVIERAAIHTVVGEDAGLAVPHIRFVPIRLPLRPPPDLPAARDSEWVLFDSDTGGEHRMMRHSLVGLTASIRAETVKNGTTKEIVWGTFCDIRRPDGLQIFLRALLGRTPLVLTEADEGQDDFLARLSRYGVTHLTGTSLQWRRALMSPANVKIAPRRVFLSDGAADQAALDRLRARFPGAVIANGRTSRETGIDFEVSDRLDDFPLPPIGLASS
jgi:hypothetical protein